MRKILYIFIAIFAACSCNQLYKESWELAVDSDLYKVSNTVTKTAYYSLLYIALECRTGFRTGLG